MLQQATKIDYIPFDDLYEEWYLLLPYTYLVTCSDHTYHMHTDWLLDRRHCDSKWHSQVKAIQERVAQAQKTLPNTEQLAKITQTESRMSCDIRVCITCTSCDVRVCITCTSCDIRVCITCTSCDIEYASHACHVTTYLIHHVCYTGFRHKHAL